VRKIFASVGRKPKTSAVGQSSRSMIFEGALFKCAISGAMLIWSNMFAAAGPFPERPVQLIVPFASGGGLDQNARAFGKALAEVLKAPVVVVNRDGAAGTIGLQTAAMSQPDGYTLAFTPAVPLTSEPHRLKSNRYGMDSFVPVCQIFENIFAIAVMSDSPYRSLKDILDTARSKPGTMNYGTAGTGSIPHLGTADIEAASQVKFTHIPYKGDAPMLQDLIGRTLDFGAMLASSISGQVQAGTMRLLAVYSDRRHPAFPDVPTLAEAGVPVSQLSFGGLLLPAKTPPEIVETLEAGCESAAKAPGYVAWAMQAGQVLNYQPARDFGQRLRQDSEAKAASINRLGL
jgi:tripartite-type tricarboxylate transporter receptor subunit TctC